MRGTKKTILVVDDDENNGYLLGITLRKMGYSVIGIVDDALQALRQVELNRPNIVITDVNLQGEKDGVWLGKQLANKNISFLFLTKAKDQDTIIRAVGVSPKGYLIRPYSPSSLFANIEIATTG